MISRPADRKAAEEDSDRAGQDSAPDCYGSQRSAYQQCRPSTATHRSTIASEIPLPELPAADLPPDPSLHVALSDNAVIPAATTPDWQHGFVDPQGNIAFRCLRIDRDFYFDFPGIGQARLTPDDRILIWQDNAASIESIRHVLLDQVLPRLLAQRGHLVLHGSAVRTPNNQVLVILGDSGMGKSTLASAFACSGADVLSDDGVLLDFTPPRIRAVPGYPGLRLWPDSLARVVRRPRRAIHSDVALQRQAPPGPARTGRQRRARPQSTPSCCCSHRATTGPSPSNR